MLYVFYKIKITILLLHLLLNYYEQYYFHFEKRMILVFLRLLNNENDNEKYTKNA
jgi:hypothetical protein